MASTTHDETVATYTVRDKTYEVDHLGINYPDTQWGSFAVYCDGEMITGFDIEAMALATGPRPAELPVSTEDLIRAAVQVVGEEAGGDDPVYPQPGAPIPLELNGGMAGFVVGECLHRVAESEWRAGLRNCERCPQAVLHSWESTAPGHRCECGREFPSEMDLDAHIADFGPMPTDDED